MLNRGISSWTQGGNHSGEGYTSISRTPIQTSGIRTRWRMFGQTARSILCIRAESHTDTDYTTTGADVPCGAFSAPNSAGRSRPGRANTSKEAESAWFDKTTRKLRRLHSEPGAAARQRQRKRGARSDIRGEGSQSYDDDLHHRMARLHLIATTATGERIHAPPTASGNNTDALKPRKLLLIGANPREEEPGAEKPQSSYLQGPEKDEKGGADVRKAAWETLKRRVLDAEEHGSSPLPPPPDMGAGGHDADLALREIRARLRQGWAEEVMRVKAREESVKSTKKRRRDAGCWIRENGALLKCTVTHMHALDSTLH